MPIQTRINAEFIGNIVWDLRINLNQLNDRAGLSKGYLYKMLKSPKNGVNIATLDALHNAIEKRMLELHIAPPDNLWNRLVVHTRVPSHLSPEPYTPEPYRRNKT